MTKEPHVTDSLLNWVSNYDMTEKSYILTGQPYGI